jgi:hypothetical protein
LWGSKRAVGEGPDRLREREKTELRELIKIIKKEKESSRRLTDVIVGAVGEEEPTPGEKKHLKDLDNHKIKSDLTNKTLSDSHIKRLGT